jgi:hypothetical protein
MMEMPIEKPFTGHIFNVALIGVDRIRVRDIIAPTVFKESSGMISISTKKFKLPSGLDAKLNCHIVDDYRLKSIFSKNLQNLYSMVVICVDANDGENLYKLDQMINAVSENAQTSAIKMCIVSKLKDSGFGCLIQDTAKQHNIPFLSFESLNTGNLLLQLESYANELLYTNSPKIVSQFWGKPIYLQQVNKESLVQIFEDAKKGYIKSNATFYKPEMFLEYQINNRIPKPLTDDNCYKKLCALLKDEGKTTLNSYKFFVITRMLSGDNQISSDEDAKNQIDSAISLLTDYSARRYNKKDVITKMMYMRFFAQTSQVPEELIKTINQSIVDVSVPRNEEPSLTSSGK